MARKGRKRALEDGQAPAEIKKDDNFDGQGLTELERRRAEIVAHNRQRLLALGIPSLRAELEAAAAPKKKAERKPRVKKEQGTEQPPMRHSNRLKEAQEHPKPEPETAEQRFERELGEAVVNDECPRCGKELHRGHRKHLQSCTGTRPKRATVEGMPHPRDAALEELSAEERKDAHARLLARMKAVHLDGITELSQEHARFVVLGSTGNHYNITLKDDKHTCTCLDYRFRRHNCKHIMAVLQQLGIMDRPTQWRAAVDERMDELVEQQAELARERSQEQQPPRSKAEQVALKLLD